MLTSRDIHRSLHRRVTVAPALVFTDTLASADVIRAGVRSGVVVLPDTSGLAGRLAAAASADPQLNPPALEHAVAEMRALHNAGAPSTGPPA